MNQTVLHEVLEQAGKNDAKPAVYHNDESISYRQLYASIENTASALYEYGIRKGDRVCLFVNNSIAYIILYYAIWRCGGVVVALNTESKSRDVNNWISHSDAKLFIFDKAIPESGKIVSDNQISRNIEFNELLAVTEKEDQPLNADYPDADDIAAIIYTSGTTGNPKGVTLTHKNIYANMHSILSYLPIDNSDVFVNVLPFYYSFGNSVLHTYLMRGASIVLVNSMMFPNKVLEAIDKYKGTAFSGVPSTYLLLFNRSNISNYNLSSLKYLTQAGGPMAPATTRKIMNAMPGVNIYIMYGQTEATARLAYLEPEKIFEKMSSIGKAIPGVQLKIVKEDGKRANVNETGIIHAAGDNIMKGYWKDSDLTRKTINDGWLNTGDLARYDEEDYLYIIGRSSEMIKSGANRISPKEIEEVLLMLPEIIECAVKGVPDDLMGEVIKAYVVSSQEIDILKIKRHCKDNLATYKIPKYIEQIDSLPKTSSGKVKKYLLN